MAQLDCKHFSGYRPCGYEGPCNQKCLSYLPIQNYILIIHLEALGSVLRTTSILPAIKRKYPHSHITWITSAPANQLLSPNPYIDQVLTLKLEDVLTLSAREFDVGFVVDKSLKAAGVLKQTHCREVFGFVSDQNGKIIPAHPSAEELWQIGLSNHLKFFLNKKPETQLLIESLDLGSYCRDSYQVFLTPQEKQVIHARKKLWGQGVDFIIGLNTGCSSTLPNKKMTVDKHRDLIKQLISQFPRSRIVLLGGGIEDKIRNQQMGDGFSVIQSSTDNGIRDGLCSVASCDVIISGDSLGMHMAIALKKKVIAWFGPTCAQEIDFFDSGWVVKSPVSCGPCWKKTCQQSPLCYDVVPLDKMIEAVRSAMKNPSFREGSDKPA